VCQPRSVVVVEYLSSVVRPPQERLRRARRVMRRGQLVLVKSGVAVFVHNAHPHVSLLAALGSKLIRSEVEGRK
jgi:hypothetical protein